MNTTLLYSYQIQRFHITIKPQLKDLTAQSHIWHKNQPASKALVHRICIPFTEKSIQQYIHILYASMDTTKTW